MDEPPFITKKRVMKELGLTSAQAYVLLKEMTDMDKIKKFGRGDDAVYKVVIQPTLNIGFAKLSRMAESVVVGPIHNEEDAA